MPSLPSMGGKSGGGSGGGSNSAGAPPSVPPPSLTPTPSIPTLPPIPPITPPRPKPPVTPKTPHPVPPTATPAQQVAGSVGICPTGSTLDAVATLTSLFTSPHCSSVATIATTTPPALADGKMHLAIISTANTISWVAIAPSSDTVSCTLSNAPHTLLVIGPARSEYKVPGPGIYTLSCSSGALSTAKAITI